MKPLTVVLIIVGTILATWFVLTLIGKAMVKSYQVGQGLPPGLHAPYPDSYFARTASGAVDYSRKADGTPIPF